MKALSPEASRFAALGILFALLLVLALYVVMPLARYYTDSIADVGLKKRQLAQYEYLLNNETEIDEQLARMEDSETGDLFLAGGNASIAAANIRELLEDIVRDSGGELVSSQDYEAAAVAGTTAVGLQLQIRGEAGSLVQVLHAIESLRPVLFVDELAVSSSNKRSMSSREMRRAQTRGPAPSLEIRINVVGYLLGSEESPSESAG